MTENAKNANVFDSFASLVQFYPKLMTSIAIGVMDLAASSMKPFGRMDSRSTGLIEDKPLRLPSRRVRLSSQQNKKQVVARKSTKRSARPRKAAA